MLHHVHAREAEGRQTLGQLVGRKLQAGGQIQWLAVAERRIETLDGGKDGRDEDERALRPPGQVRRPGPAAGGEWARADALVREGLPGRKQLGAVLPEERGGAGDQGFGRARIGGHQEHGSRQRVGQHGGSERVTGVGGVGGANRVAPGQKAFERGRGGGPVENAADVLAAGHAPPR